jgi:hypothetical protein
MRRGPGLVFQAFGGAVHQVREIKKADVAKHAEVFHHIGLIVNEQPGTSGLLYIKSSDKLNQVLTEPQLAYRHSANSMDHTTAGGRATVPFFRIEGLASRDAYNCVRNGSFLGKAN